MSSKKDRFMEKKKNNNNTVFIAVGIGIVLMAAVAFFSLKGTDAPTAGGNTETIKEVTITPTVSEDKLIIKKSEVEQNKIVRFEYEPVKLTLKSGAEIAFPLMAYVKPSGEIVVAVRMCEPCNGLTFSTIGGNILNCDTCGTQWDLQTNEWNGVGAESCGLYAPEVIPNVTINGDDIEINIKDFQDWMPRA